MTSCLPALQPTNARYTVTVTYTSALVANVGGVEKTITDGSAATATGFCDVYGICDELATR